MAHDKDPESCGFLVGFGFGWFYWMIFWQVPQLTFSLQLLTFS
jgi:hypothetical protein